MRPTVDIVYGTGKVKALPDGPDLVVAIRREDLGRIADDGIIPLSTLFSSDDLSIRLIQAEMLRQRLDRHGAIQLRVAAASDLT